NSLKYCFRIFIMQSGTWCISNAFHRRLCGTDLYALARSSQMTCKSTLLDLALWIASHIIEECSRHPGTPGTPPFWIDVSTMTLLDVSTMTLLDVSTMTLLDVSNMTIWIDVSTRYLMSHCS